MNRDVMCHPGKLGTISSFAEFKYPCSTVRASRYEPCTIRTECQCLNTAIVVDLYKLQICQVWVSVEDPHNSVFATNRKTISGGANSKTVDRSVQLHTTEL